MTARIAAHPDVAVNLGDGVHTQNVIRLVFDAACILLSVVMLIRLKPRLQPGALAKGAAFVMALWIGNTLVSLWLDPDFMYDAGMGACVLALTLVSKFDWASAVPAGYRRDGVEGVLRTSRKLQVLFCVLLLGIAFSVEALVHATGG
jgi:hypothetical protein